jgi:hypothetical protein
MLNDEKRARELDRLNPSTPPGFSEENWASFPIEERCAWIVKEHLIQMHEDYDAFDEKGRLDESLLTELEELSPGLLYALVVALKSDAIVAALKA